MSSSRKFSELFRTLQNSGKVLRSSQNLPELEQTSQNSSKLSKLSVNHSKVIEKDQLANPYTLSMSKPLPIEILNIQNVRWRSEKVLNVLRVGWFIQDHRIFEGFGSIYQSQPSYKLPPCASPNSTSNLLPHWHRVVFQRHCTARSDMILFNGGQERQICVSRATSNASSAIWNRALLKSFNSQWFVWPRFNRNTMNHEVPMCPHPARYVHGFLGKVLSL